MSSENPKYRAPQPLQYADEILCANWNPLARMLVEPLAQAQTLVFDAAETDVDAFLARLYRCQQS